MNRIRLKNIFFKAEKKKTIKITQNKENFT